MKRTFLAALSLLLACSLFWAAAACGAACNRNGSKEGEGQTAAPAENAEEQATADENSLTNKTDGQRKQIWLTFDDGPTDSSTPKILDILKKENVKATFFVVGRQIAKREKILQREWDEGHAIGIHTYTHEYKRIYASANALLKDIALCDEAIRSVLPDFKTDLYRFPGGSYGIKKSMVAAVENAGYRHYDWNASAEDAVRPDTPASVLYQNVLDSAASKNEVILLMHDGVGYKETIKCLPSVIKHFREKGFAFCTL
ncbi:MAG TPA: polysaccharide deacetylase [Candidatus Borkfalkia excrementipullorum]|nr:polysaccharide deacetylase [Candidatus Borkfalkia excrementipullorum]